MTETGSMETQVHREAIWPKVAIIILNWNGWHDTIECLESLLAINYTNYNILVIDNGSQDSSIEKIKEYCEGKLEVESPFISMHGNKPIKLKEFFKNEIEDNEKNVCSEYYKLILIKNDRNYGFAEGNNIGIRFVQDCINSKYILLLNNDTVVDRDFLFELVKTAEMDFDAGFIGPKIYYYDWNGLKNVINFAGGKLSMSRAQSYHIGVNEIDCGQYNSTRTVDYIEGSCMLIKNEALYKIGLLDQSFFAYWEENDLCIRGLRAGFKSVYAPNAMIWHKISRVHSGTLNETKIFFMVRNRILFMRKNAKTIYKYTFIPFLIRDLIFLICLSIYKGRSMDQNLSLVNKLIKAVWQGISYAQ